MVRRRSAYVKMGGTHAPVAARQRARRRDDPRAVALRLLAVRPRSTQELADRLRVKGFAPARVAEVLRELTEHGLLDDAQVALALIESALRRKPVGRKALLWKLRRLKIPAAVAEAALARAAPHAEEQVRARAAAEAKLTKLRQRQPGISWSALESRLGRFLLSRGFSSEVVHDLLDDLRQREAG